MITKKQSINPDHHYGRLRVYCDIILEHHDTIIQCTHQITKKLWLSNVAGGMMSTHLSCRLPERPRAPKSRVTANHLQSWGAFWWLINVAVR